MKQQEDDRNRIAGTMTEEVYMLFRAVSVSPSVFRGLPLQTILSLALILLVRVMQHCSKKTERPFSAFCENQFTVYLKKVVSSNLLYVRRRGTKPRPHGF